MVYYVFITFLVLFTKIISTICNDPPITTTKAPSPKNDWDFLIFTQRWPLTACSQWEETATNNTCAFPDPQDLWTIHGIWPTKEGTKGPGNCNNTWHFNATLIQPIKPQLENYWTNIEKNTKLTSLWNHEWTKHGTCAAILPQLNNEFKYFQQGLEWILKYNMKNVLSKQNIIPSQQGYTVQRISDAVITVLNKNPVIECVTDKYTKQSLLSEIRICFDKGLNLIDCNGAKALEEHIVKEGDLITNCNLKKLVMYIDHITPSTTTPKPTVPTTTITTSKTPKRTTVRTTLNSMTTSSLDSLIKTRKRLINLYKTIRLLIWATI